MQSPFIALQASVNRKVGGRNSQLSHRWRLRVLMFLSFAKSSVGQGRRIPYQAKTSGLSYFKICCQKKIDPKGRTSQIQERCTRKSKLRLSLGFCIGRRGKRTTKQNRDVYYMPVYTHVFATPKMYEMSPLQISLGYFEASESEYILLVHVLYISNVFNKCDLWPLT